MLFCFILSVLWKQIHQTLLSSFPSDFSSCKRRLISSAAVAVWHWSLTHMVLTYRLPSVRLTAGSVCSASPSTFRTFKPVEVVGVNTAAILSRLHHHKSKIPLGRLQKHSTLKQKRERWIIQNQFIPLLQISCHVDGLSLACDPHSPKAKERKKKKIHSHRKYFFFLGSVSHILTEWGQSNLIYGDKNFCFLSRA